MKKVALALSFFLLCCRVAAGDEVAEGKVVVTIKPLHSLVAAVMGDTGTPALLMKGHWDIHHYHFKPSQLEQLQQADIVFYIDEKLEAALSGIAKSLPLRTVLFGVVHQNPDLVLWPVRRGDEWHIARNNAVEEVDLHGPTKRDIEHDMHVWLDPMNAEMIVRSIARVLGDVYQENRHIYKENAARLSSQLRALHMDLKTQMAKIEKRSFVVWHDGYQYFERTYGLVALGAISAEGATLSARRIKHIRDELRSMRTACLFKAPQVADRLTQVMTENLPVRVAALDGVGMQLEPGPNLYFDLMRGMADVFLGCLAGAG